MADHGQQLAGVGIDSHHRAGPAAQGFLGPLLHDQINGQVEVIALGRLDRIGHLSLMAQRIDLDPLQSVAAAQPRIIAPLDPRLADDHAGQQASSVVAFQLFGRDFADVAEQVGRQGPVQIVAARLDLDLHARQVQPVRFQLGRLGQAQALFDQHRQKGLAALAVQARLDLGRRPAQHATDLGQGRRGIGHILPNKVEIQAGRIGHDESAVAVIDQPAGRLNRNITKPVLLRQLQIIVAIDHLQSPQSTDQQEDRHADQRHHPEEAVMEFPDLIVGG